MPLLKNFKPVQPDESEIASFRRKLSELIRRMQADYERELKPLVVKMGARAREAASEEIKAAQATAFKADAVIFFTAYEVARQLHILKFEVIQDCQYGKIPGALFYDNEWHIPEGAIEDYGISKGKIDPEKELMDKFESKLKVLRRKYDSLIHAYQSMAEQFTEKMYQKAKRQFDKQFAKFGKIDILSKLADRGLREAFDMEVAKNIQLINSIPQKYFSEIQRMTVASISGQQKFEGGLTQAIQDLTATTRKRAKIIARDQSAKSISVFTALRTTNLGIKKYIWRTSKDRRVAGNPNGLYPDVNPRSKAHGNHWKREGKVFEYAKPPPDGNPGQSILCRCWAEPLIEED